MFASSGLRTYSKSSSHDPGKGSTFTLKVSFVASLDGEELTGCPRCFINPNRTAIRTSPKAPTAIVVTQTFDLGISRALMTAGPAGRDSGPSAFAFGAPGSIVTGRFAR